MDHRSLQYRALSLLYEPAFLQEQSPQLADLLRKQEEIDAAAAESTCLSLAARMWVWWGGGGFCYGCFEVG